MVSDSIERELLIEAPVETVWSIVTEPEHIAGWFSDSAEVDLRPGGELLLGWEAFGTTSATVERVERPHLFSFRWVSPEPDRDPNAGEGYATLVEFRLRAEGEGTMLRVVESGFASLAGSEEQNAQLAERHAGGWGSFLDKLAGYASTVDAPA
ncbi:MAG TPA: SRPBCC domain-containing protein [Solirubrobacterales bacterium]